MKRWKSRRGREIRARSHNVTSFLAEYRALLKFQLVRIEVAGKDLVPESRQVSIGNTDRR